MKQKSISNAKMFFFFFIEPVKVCHHSGGDLREKDDGEEGRVGQDKRVALTADAAAANQSYYQDQNSWNKQKI